MYPQLDSSDAKVQAILHTNVGDITVKLFPDIAPKTVENFIGLAKKGYYDGVIFHRVIPDFMIQGGDPSGTGMDGESLWGTPFEDEFSQEVFNLRGALSMANAGPNTNGSQFFIVTNAHVDDKALAQMKASGYPEAIVEAYRHGGTPWLDGHHTVFGQTIAGLEVADKISRVKTRADKPVEPIVIESVDIRE